MNIKRAFTLSELILTMGIIGIICTFGFKTLQAVDKNAIYSYSNVYHSLDKALYNAMNFTNLPSPFSDSQIEDGAEVSIDEDEMRYRLCMYLTEYINTHDRTCKADAVSPVGEGIADEQPAFLSHTGIKFYISDRLGGDENYPHSFFIVFADINGNKAPNSMEYVENVKDPDIFAFAALDIGRICPLGPPEVDPKFMKTRITYYKHENDEIHEKFSVTSKPYYISKAEAWGYYLKDDPLTGNDGKAFYIDDEPFSYNDYIRNCLKDNNGSGGEIYAFLEGKQLQVPAGVTLKSESTENGGYNCSRGNATDCEIIIDKYVY